jgi:serine/threonine protein phosphatase PrpC
MEYKNLFGSSASGAAEKTQVAGVPPGSAPRWQWRSHGISVVGYRRKINEDAFLERPDIGLWMVADGMGGHHAGDVASNTLVEILGGVEASLGLDTLERRVAQGIHEANARLHRLAKESDGQIIGSTVVALLAQNLQCAALWAGDSRLYRYRGDRLEQLTSDHSLIEDLVKAGLMNAEEASLESSSSNIITRAVGAESELNLDGIRFDAQGGDIYLLCSDGLVKEVKASAIASQMEGGDIAACAQALIDAALASGGRDNITVVLIRPVAAQ